MSFIPDGPDEKRNPSKAFMTPGFIIAATVLVTSSLFAAFGTTPKFTPASAQITTQPMNTTQQNQTSAASSPLSAAIERLREQARLHEQQQANMNITEDTKQKARDVAKAVDGVLIYYARALGEKNIEPINVTAANATVLDVRIPLVPLTGLEEGNATSSGNKIVSQSDYLIAQGLALKAIVSFSEVAASASQTADPVTMQQLADTQEGLTILYSLIQSRAPYNLLEDIAISPIQTNIGHIYGAPSSTIS